MQSLAFVLARVVFKPFLGERSNAGAVLAGMFWGTESRATNHAGRRGGVGFPVPRIMRVQEQG